MLLLYFSRVRSAPAGIDLAVASGGVAFYGFADDNGSRGMLSTDTVITTNDQFTVEMKPESGAVLTIQRFAPPRLDKVMDLK